MSGNRIKSLNLSADGISPNEVDSSPMFSFVSHRTPEEIKVEEEPM